MPTGAALIVSQLERAGVEVVFGLPGVHNLALWEELRTSPIRLVGVRHEQAAAYAADGYARATGRLGVAVVTTGPGAANTLGATGEAMASGAPVLVVATDIPSTLRRPGVYRGVLHETRDQAAMFAPVTKDELARARELLARGRRPLVWAGGGALRSGAGDLVGELAERLAAPVVTTFGGRGLLPPDHPCLVPGPPHVPAVGRLWDEADLVIALGSDLDGTNTQNWAMPRPPALL